MEICSQRNFILLWQVDENAVEKNLAHFLEYENFN